MVVLVVAQLDSHQQDMQMVIEEVVRNQGRVKDLIKTDRAIISVAPVLTKQLVHLLPIDDLFLDE